MTVERTTPPTGEGAWSIVQEVMPEIRQQIRKRMRFAPPGVTEEDIAQEASIFLFMRLPKWDPERSAWEAFLKSSIWQEVGRALQTGRASKDRAPASRASAFRKAWAAFTSEHHRSPTPRELREHAEPLMPGFVSRSYGLSQDLVDAWLQGGDHTSAVCIDLPEEPLVDMVAAESTAFEVVDSKRKLALVWSVAQNLRPEEVEVLYRHLNDETLADIGERFGITRAAVRAREKTILKKVRKRLRINIP